MNLIKDMTGFRNIKKGKNITKYPIGYIIAAINELKDYTLKSSWKVFSWKEEGEKIVTIDSLFPDPDTGDFVRLLITPEEINRDFASAIEVLFSEKKGYAKAFNTNLMLNLEDYR